MTTYPALARFQVLCLKEHQRLGHTSTFEMCKNVLCRIDKGHLNKLFQPVLGRDRYQEE